MDNYICCSKPLITKRKTQNNMLINRLVASFLSPFSIQMQNFQLKICIYKQIMKTKKSGFHFQTKTNRLPYMFFFLEILDILYKISFFQTKPSTSNLTKFVFYRDIMHLPYDEVGLQFEHKSSHNLDWDLHLALRENFGGFFFVILTRFVSLCDDEWE